MVVHVQKNCKPGVAITSYKPVSLTSATGKLMQTFALTRLSWFAEPDDFLLEQLTGCHRYHFTVDSIAGVFSPSKMP